MIDDALNLLKGKLNEYFKLKTDITDDKVAYLDGSKMDPITFPLNAITPIIVNIQEERQLRQADYYKAVVKNGVKTEVAPEVRIKFNVLFVARFTDYDQGLKFLSLIIRFFQANRLITHDDAPEMDADIDRLFIELITMPQSEQNDIWNALRTTYLPSIAYRVSMLTFKDGETLQQISELQSVDTNLSAN